MHRPTCGIVTILLFVASGLCWYYAGYQNLWTGAFFKVAILTGALWLAHPQLEKLPVKLLVVVAGALIVVAMIVLRRPQAIALFAGVLIVMIKLRPLLGTMRPQGRAPASPRRD